MDSAACEACRTAREGDTDELGSPMALLPPETMIQIMSHISSQQSLSRLSQICRAWYGPATQELYTRDAKEHGSFAMKWMAAHAVDEQTTDSAIGTLGNSRRWGGQIDAVTPRPSRSNEAQSDDKDQIMYDTSTALHFAVFLGNMRLMKTILDMEASVTIPCPALLWTIMGAEELLLRARSFQKVFEECRFGPAFPIFLAFLQSDPDMCKLLIDHGAGREALMVYLYGESKVMSILHFAAADPTTDYRQWQCLFDKFREYIDEPCPRKSECTLLGVAMINGCTQGMQIAVESGADTSSGNYDMGRALMFGMTGLLKLSIANLKKFEEHARCLWKFVDLGGNSDGDSLILLVVQTYSMFPEQRPAMRHLLYFLLEYPADVHRTSRWQDGEVVYEIVACILAYSNRSPIQAFLKELLIDLVDRGLNLTKLSPRLPSPLYRVLHDRNARPEWLLDFLCENGATIHEREVYFAFLCWRETPRLWETNEYDAWWQHQGQEDEMFQKWCEHPYNAWWWKHVERLPKGTIKMACHRAFMKSRQLFDILTHLPLLSSLDLEWLMSQRSQRAQEADECSSINEESRLERKGKKSKRGAAGVEP